MISSEMEMSRETADRKRRARARGRERVKDRFKGAAAVAGAALRADILLLKYDSRIIRQSSNPVLCGFSMTEQVRLCVVLPTENWLGSSMNPIQGWKTVLESYCHDLEKRCLTQDRPRHPGRLPAARGRFS